MRLRMKKTCSVVVNSTPIIISSRFSFMYTRSNFIFNENILLQKMIFTFTLALDKTICTIYVDFGKNAERFGRISWSQIEKGNQKYLDIQLKVFRKDDKGDFHRHQQINLGVFDFKQLLCLRNPIVLAVREFFKDKTLKEVVISPLSKDSDEQLKHVQKAFTIVDWPKKKIFATMKK